MRTAFVCPWNGAVCHWTIFSAGHALVLRTAHGSQCWLVLQPIDLKVASNLSHWTARNSRTISYQFPQVRRLRQQAQGSRELLGWGRQSLGSPQKTCIPCPSSTHTREPEPEDTGSHPSLTDSDHRVYALGPPVSSSVKGECRIDDLSCPTERWNAFIP